MTGLLHNAAGRFGVAQKFNGAAWDHFNAGGSVSDALKHQQRLTESDLNFINRAYIEFVRRMMNIPTERDPGPVDDAIAQFYHAFKTRHKGVLKLSTYVFNDKFADPRHKHVSSLCRFAKLGCLHILRLILSDDTVREHGALHRLLGVDNDLDNDLLLHHQSQRTRTEQSKIADGVGVGAAQFSVLIFTILNCPAVDTMDKLMATCGDLNPAEASLVFSAHVWIAWSLLVWMEKLNDNGASRRNSATYFVRNPFDAVLWDSWPLNRDKLLAVIRYTLDGTTAASEPRVNFGPTERILLRESPEIIDAVLMSEHVNTEFLVHLATNEVRFNLPANEQTFKRALTVCASSQAHLKALVKNNWDELVSGRASADLIRLLFDSVYAFHVVHTTLEECVYQLVCVHRATTMHAIRNFCTNERPREALRLLESESFCKVLPHAVSDDIFNDPGLRFECAVVVMPYAQLVPATYVQRIMSTPCAESCMLLEWLFRTCLRSVQEVDVNSWLDKHVNAVWASIVNSHANKEHKRQHVEMIALLASQATSISELLFARMVLVATFFCRPDIITIPLSRTMMGQHAATPPPPPPPISPNTLFTFVSSVVVDATLLTDTASALSIKIPAVRKQRLLSPHNVLPSIWLTSCRALLQMCSTKLDLMPNSNVQFAERAAKEIYTVALLGMTLIGLPATYTECTPLTDRRLCYSLEDEQLFSHANILRFVSNRDSSTANTASRRNKLVLQVMLLSAKHAGGINSANEFRVWCDSIIHEFAKNNPRLAVQMIVNLVPLINSDALPTPTGRTALDDDLLAVVEHIRNAFASDEYAAEILLDLADIMPEIITREFVVWVLTFGRPELAVRIMWALRVPKTDGNDDDGPMTSNFSNDFVECEPLLIIDCITGAKTHPHLNVVFQSMFASYSAADNFVQAHENILDQKKLLSGLETRRVK